MKMDRNGSSKTSSFSVSETQSTTSTKHIEFFSVGDLVEALRFIYGKCQSGIWEKGCIAKVVDEDVYNIRYDSGEFGRAVFGTQIRKRVPSIDQNIQVAYYQIIRIFSIVDSNS
jgi:hypothetical protein